MRQQASSFNQSHRCDSLNILNTQNLKICTKGRFVHISPSILGISFGLSSYAIERLHETRPAWSGRRVNARKHWKNATIFLVSVVVWIWQSSRVSERPRSERSVRSQTHRRGAESGGWIGWRWNGMEEIEIKYELTLEYRCSLVSTGTAHVARHGPRARRRLA